MINNFSYHMPVKLHFGFGLADNIDEIVADTEFKSGVLLCDAHFVKSGIAEKIKNNSKVITAIYSDITPSPLLSQAETAAKLLKESAADFVMALGGGGSGAWVIFAGHPGGKGGNGYAALFY